MLVSGFILSALLLLFSGSARGKRPTCRNDCCSFLEGFPVRLKALRSSYQNILTFYESSDDLDALLDDSVQQSINGPYGCHVVNEILRFYLKTVLPTAVKNRTHIRTHINSFGNIFQNLKRNMLKCRNYFSCRKPFKISSMRKSYEQMEENGLNKAMGELDLLFKYIEQYLASKRVKQ